MRRLRRSGKSRYIATVATVAALLECGVTLSAPSGSGVLLFHEVAAASGIRASMHCGGPEKRWITEANGSGAAWLDYDHDGYMDLLIVNGGTMDGLRRMLAGSEPVQQEEGIYLYRNLGNGQFKDVTAAAGLRNLYWGTGANVADYDNDGWPDILTTSIGTAVLFHNNGNGTFSDVSTSSGLREAIGKRPRWFTGSAWGDFDGDGNLDLLLVGYVNLQSMSWAEPAPVCDNFGQKTFCGPVGLQGERPMLLRNALGSGGSHAFTDVTAAAGLENLRPAHGFTPVTADLNRDGRLDVFVTDDSDPNYLFLNEGSLHFREAALEYGVAFNADGRAQSNMGVAIGTFGNSGGPDLLTTTFQNDYFPLFRRGKSGLYDEVATSEGLAAATSHLLGWACGLTDFDNHGTLDFWTANGHVYPTDPNYLQPIVIFRSTGGHARAIYSYPQHPDNSYRGGAVADFDNDGKLDLLVLPIAGAPVLLHNETVGTGNWIGVSLHGSGKSNRDAIGASVSVSACGHEQSDTLRNGGGYISHDDERLHFGLGDCAKVDRLGVHWPDGRTQEVKDIAVGRYVTVDERP